MPGATPAGATSAAAAATAAAQKVPIEITALHELLSTTNDATAQTEKQVGQVQALSREVFDRDAPSGIKDKIEAGALALHPSTPVVLHPSTALVLRPSTPLVLHPSTTLVLHPSTSLVLHSSGIKDQIEAGPPRHGLCGIGIY